VNHKTYRPAKRGWVLACQEGGNVWFLVKTIKKKISIRNKTPKEIKFQTFSTKQFVNDPYFLQIFFGQLKFNFYVCTVKMNSNLNLHSQ